MKYELLVKPAQSLRPMPAGNYEWKDLGPPSKYNALRIANSMSHSLSNAIYRDMCREYAASLLPKGGVGLEIGVDAGNGLDLWLTSGPSFIVAVDPYVVHDDGWSARDQESMDARYSSAMERYRGSCVNIIRCTSDRYFESVEDGPMFDWVHVDGGHLYDQALRDIKNSWRLLKAGGLLMCDDCSGMTGFFSEECGRAWREFVRSVDCCILQNDGEPCVARKPI